MYLAGGGTPQQEALVWRAAFEGVRRVLYWPFALPPELLPGAERWLRAALIDLDIRAEVTAWPSPLQHDPHELDDCDLLFVGGGLTSRLVEAIEDADLLEHVRRFITAGGRYYGGSAGALLPCEVVTAAALVDDDPRADGMKGLGLLRGLTVLPHANRFSDTRPAEVAAAVGHPVLAIPETSGVAIAGGRLQVIGPDPVRLVGHEGDRLLAAGAVEHIGR